MKAIFNRSYLCDVPDTMAPKDTIILNETVYEICTKTIDLDNSELYCIVAKYENEEKQETTIVEILTKLYGSKYFKTVGRNTNEIINNPKLIALIIIASVIIDKNHMLKNNKTYKNNIIANWNNKNILWSEIFNDNPPIKHKDLNIISKASKVILQQHKILKSAWPVGLRQFY